VNGNTEGVAARSGGGTRADGRATAEQVVVAVERLFAERGVEGAVTMSASWRGWPPSGTGRHGSRSWMIPPRPASGPPKSSSEDPRRPQPESAPA
jgi:hypothetical protein